jgi:hypothetical protein
MDTRFWGPSGWRILHMVSFQAPTLPTTPLGTFFENIPYVLPCKYCRASLTDYIFADPIPAAKDMAEWLHRIHNRVNCKLREQKLLNTPNPKWPEIQKRYHAWMTAPCTKRRMVGWDFLFSIANTTPSTTTKSTPMPGAPPELPTNALKNRWNVLTATERFPYLEAWWGTLAVILPFSEWRTAWQQALKTHGKAPVRKGKRAMVTWLYAMERSICAHLKESTPHDSFEGLCSELATFSSGCGKSKRSKTCRATKGRARATLKQRRASTYRAVGGYL